MIRLMGDHCAAQDWLGELARLDLPYVIDKSVTSVVDRQILALYRRNDRIK
jgi:hypothetical protein